MLDGILGRGFSAKCKSLMKTTRSRIDVVRRRAESKQRFLNEDLAKLLSNGLDINAYGRTEEFLAGMNLLWSYDFVEQSCEYIVKQLPRMQKQEDCPEECREAVASLTYAAARFSDLPELRELRDIFQQRYGSCIEAFVSQKLIENMSSSPPPKEKRLQVLQNIASEFSIRWDSRGFERRMATPAIVAQVDEQRVDIVKQRQGPLVEKSRARNYEEGNIQKRNEGDVHISKRKEAIEYREKSHLKSGGSNLHIDEQRIDIVKQRQGPVVEKSRVRSYEEGNIQKRNEGDNNHISRRKEAIEYREKPLLKSGGSSSQGDDDLLYCGRRVFTESKHSYPIEKASPDLNVEKSNISSHGKVQDNNVHMRHSNGTRNPRIGESTEGFSIKKGVDEGSDKLKSPPGYALPPPYIKSNQNLSRPPPYVKPEEDKRKISRDSKHAGPRNEAGRHDYEEQSVAPAKLRSRGHEKEFDDIKSNQNLSRPPPYVKPEEDKHKISRDSKHAGAHNEADRHDYEEQSVAPAKLRSYGHEKELDYPNDKFPLPKPRSLRRKHQKSSVEDDVAVKSSSSSSRRKEHSKKGLQTLFDEEHHVKDDEERMIDKLLIHYSKKPSNFDAGNLRKKSREGESSLDQSRNGNCEVLPLPVRSVSLPPIQAAPQESDKVFARSNTFQEDNQARHVHPKLPNYDDLAARFAALKGR